MAPPANQSPRAGTRQLGTTELLSSAIGFGCSRVGGVSAAGPKRTQVVKLLHEALESGINFFDTADAYAQGDSEHVLGEAFQHKRDRVILATKGGYIFEERVVTASPLQPARSVLDKIRGKVRQTLGAPAEFSRQNFAREYLTRAVEGSLRRLRTDYIDLYQLHAPRTVDAQSGEAIDTLQRLQQQGKIRYFGVGLESLGDVLLWLGYSELASLQLPFGLLDMEATRTVLPAIADKGRALIARGVYGGGLLKADLDEAWLKSVTPKWERIAEFHRIAARTGRPIYEVALHYVLQRPEVALVLLGMTSPAQLRSNLDCLRQGPLDDETRQAVDSVGDRFPLPNPAP